jgi:hypothetical protein
MSDSISRRTFFGRAAAAPLAIPGSPLPAEKPDKAWVILGINWEYNDEYSYEDGEHVLNQVYYDQETALAECKRLCDQFFAGQTPTDFECDWNWLDIDETDDWDAVRAAGFPDPYYVKEMVA